MDEVKGLAPTPSQLARMRVQTTQKESTEKKRGESTRTTIRSDSPPTGVRSEVGQILYGVHWTYQKRILDLMKIAVPSKKWDTIRSIVMDIMTEQVETQRTLIGQRIADHLVNQEIKEKLNGIDDLNATE